MVLSVKQKLRPIFVDNLYNELCEKKRITLGEINSLNFAKLTRLFSKTQINTVNVLKFNSIKITFVITLRLFLLGSMPTDDRRSVTSLALGLALPPRARSK